MHSEYYETLIHKHLSGELSDQEQQDLETWLEQPDNRRQFEEAERIWTLTAQAGSELDIDLNHEIARFKQRINFQENKIKPILPGKILWYAVAASVLLGGILILLELSGYDASDTILFETAHAETQEITLPDQSKIWLNENSTISYKERFETRDIEFTGEAFFEIAHNPDRPFRIQSSEGLVEVLGTSFSVRNRPDEDLMVVTVATGVVALSATGSPNREELTAGFQGTLDKNEQLLSSQPNSNPDFLGWRSRPLAFDTTPFGEVVEQLRAHYAIVINDPDPALARCTLTGQFDGKPLSDVIALLSFSLNIETTVDQGVYAFSGTGCSQ